MTYAFDDRPTGDHMSGSATEVGDLEFVRTERLLAGPTTLERMPAWTPVLLTNEPGREQREIRVRRVRRGGLSDRRLGGLDGLRAIAVMSVVLFHLDYALMPGGFLGVDVFFVISGFLITNLLAMEILASGRLRLGRFYLRRARRLLPTVLALLAVVTLAGVTVWRDQLATLKAGALSSLTYVTNWWLIADHQSYFVASGRPTMLQHLWSLAIEEQFYIVWSVVVMILAGVLVTVRRRGSDVDHARRLRYVVIVAAMLATASTIAMAYQAVHADLPYGGSTSRVYFGSDTHAMGLFLGSAAGAWLALRHHRRTANGARPRTSLVWATDAIGAGAVAVVIYEFFVVSEFSPNLYRGGFLAFDVAVLVAVLCATRPGSIFGRVLDMRPLRWLGQRSYSIYIWHWPVCVLTRPDLDVHGPALLLNTLRLTLILSVSALSYRFIEVPLRAGQLGRWRWEQRDPSVRTGEMSAAVITLVCVAALLVAANPVQAFEPPVAGPKPHATHSVAPTPSVHRTSQAAPVPTHSHSTAPPVKKHHQANPPGQPPGLSAFGDSVLLGAGNSLRAKIHHLRLDAVEGRQANDVLDDVSRVAEQRKLRANVLIHIGDNGIISPDQLETTLKALHGAKRVVLMTVLVPRDWQDPNNNTIRSVGGRFDNVDVVDWHRVAELHPSWLYDDGIHLTPSGAVGYTQVVMSALRG